MPIAAAKGISYLHTTVPSSGWVEMQSFAPIEPRPPTLAFPVWRGPGEANRAFDLRRQLSDPGSFGNEVAQ